MTVSSRTIKDNYNRVSERASQAALRAGRNPWDVGIVAVSKTFPLETVHAAIDAGITVFGENRVEEALTKIDACGENIEWHMIGQLQSRKAKDAAGRFFLIHSVDRWSLAEKLNRALEGSDRNQGILIQVDFTSRDDRGGVLLDTAELFIKKSAELKNLSVKGLMTLPPWSDNPEETRPYFRKMKELFDKIRIKGIPGVEMKYLSMGMTDDFEVAVEEGSNLIRVGRAIFGERE